MLPPAQDVDALPQTFAEAWARRVAAHPEAEALLDARDGSRFTALELDGLISRVGGGLVAAGLRPGQRLALVADPTVECVVLCAAALSQGLAVVPLPPGTPTSRVDALGRGCGVACVAEGEAWFLRLLGCPAPARPWTGGDPAAEAAVLFSSGSTGPGRGVRLSHQTLAASVRRLQVYPEPMEGLRFGFSPLLHTITGFRLALYLHAVCGAVPVLLDTAGSPAALLDQCDTAGVRWLVATPTLVRAVARAPERMPRPSRLARVFTSGGALEPQDLRAASAALGAELHYTYGSTELGGMVSSARVRPDGYLEPGVGRPLVPVRVVDPDGVVQGPGTLGLVEAAPQFGVPRPLDGAGIREDEGQVWVCSGDLGWLDVDGNLHIQGRAARLYTCPSGEKVLLDELEQALRAALGVELAVVEVRAPGRGPQLGAWLATPPEGGLVHARGVAAARLPPSARPALWVCGEPLPRAASGAKVDYVAVAARLAERV